MGIRHRFLPALIVILVLLSGSCLLPYAFRLSQPTDLSQQPPFPESRFETIDGISLHYRIWMPEDRLLGKILWIHGLGGSTYSFQKISEELAKQGWASIAVDLPLFGYSGRNIVFDHSQENRARLLWMLCDHLDDTVSGLAGAGHWIVGGHSMGGGTATAMAVQRPLETKAVLLVAPALLDDSRTSSLLTAFPPLLRWGQLYFERVLVSERSIRTILESAYARLPADSEVFAYLTPLALPGTARAVPAFLRTAKNLPAERLGEIASPVLAVWGANDTWVPVEQSKRLMELIPHAKIHVLEQAGHVPMETHPDVFLTKVIEFLEMPAQAQ